MLPPHTPSTTQPHQHPFPNINPRLGMLPPHTPSTTSHNIGIQPPSETLPPPSAMSQSHQLSLPNIDPRLSFFPLHAPVAVRPPSETPPPPATSQPHQRLPPNIDPRLEFLSPRTTVPCEVGLQPPETVSPTNLSSIPLPKMTSGSEASNSDVEEPDAEGADS
jgi:hypothetical protein